tara:strand:- start:3056 stop:3463 length:408 start_codon:yes stop_codon:yes gene_type:complete
MKLFGYKIKVELVLFIVLLYFVLSGHTICSCSKISGMEAFQTLSSSLVGTDVNYRMGEGVKGSWENKKLHDYPDEETNIGGSVSVNDSMFLLNKNKGHPDNCPSTYSSSTGCLGLTTEQNDFLNKRGGNRLYGKY